MSGTNGPTLALCLWCLVGPMCLGWDGQAPDGAMGSAGKEWPLVAGPGWGPPGRDRQGAWAKPLTPNFCARGRAHPGPFVPAGNQDQIKKSRCGAGCGPVTVRFEEAQRPGVQ